jgi:hypothetical protein
MYCSVETTELVQSHPALQISSISEDPGLALSVVLAIMVAKSSRRLQLPSSLDPVDHWLVAACCCVPSHTSQTDRSNGCEFGNFRLLSLSGPRRIRNDVISAISASAELSGPRVDIPRDLGEQFFMSYRKLYIIRHVIGIAMILILSLFVSVCNCLSLFVTVCSCL